MNKLEQMLADAKEDGQAAGYDTDRFSDGWGYGYERALKAVFDAAYKVKEQQVRLAERCNAKKKYDDAQACLHATCVIDDIVRELSALTAEKAGAE
jgi:hypothetical protein